MRIDPPINKVVGGTDVRYAWEVAEIIARLCRERKRQGHGRERYAYAIAKWEHDLARLKREYYDRASEPFRWPSTQA